MRKLSLYGLIASASTIVRQFVLPNPFECFGDKAALINWIAEPIIYIVAFWIVGQFYISKSAPPLGSLLYLLTYAIIVGVLWVLGLAEFAWWSILIAVIVLSAIGFGVYALSHLGEERYF